MSPGGMPQTEFAGRMIPVSNGGWNPRRSSFIEPFNGGGLEQPFYTLASANYSTNYFGSTPSMPPASSVSTSRSDHSFCSTSAYTPRPVSRGFVQGPITHTTPHRSSTGQSSWDIPGSYSPSDSVDDIITSPNLSDYSQEHGPGANGSGPKSKMNGKSRSQRRPSNRDEFDGPHQFLQRPSAELIAMQERDMPHLPTNLHVQEQDDILSRVNDRLSRCAFDFVAKYQFPIPLTQDMRPVERPHDREWTEWVYLLKRLATKRRIPARVLYNGQIKQFVTILENSLEMRHAAKHQSRPLKDDRNILQLISAGIQVAKILKDAAAMEYLDQLYVSTEQQIRVRTSPRYRS